MFGRASAPALSAASAGALPNTLEVERLPTVACEKVEQQFCLQEGEANGATKISSTCYGSGSTFLQGAGTLPKRPFLFKLSVFDRIKIRLERDGQKMQLRQQLTRGGYLRVFPSTSRIFWLETQVWVAWIKLTRELVGEFLETARRNDSRRQSGDHVPLIEELSLSATACCSY